MSEGRSPYPLALLPLDDVDPRLRMESGALVEASRNAFPLVARAPGRRDSLGLAAGTGIAVLLGAVTFWSMSGHRTAPALAAPAQQAPRALVPPPVSTAPAPPVGWAPGGSGRTLRMPSVASIDSEQQEALAAASAARGPAPVMVFDASSPAALPPPAGTAEAGPRAPGAGAAPASGGTEDELFGARLASRGVEVAAATPLTNPATTVTQGTLIPAVLETAIDTDLPGYVRAVVSRDVRSFDGSQVVIPRSSRLIGQYKSGLAAGQTRAYVIWTRLIRPDGASVALSSPAVDASGRSGLAGKVDGHFIKRFGSAVLLSVVGGLSAIGDASVVLSGGQSAATVAAQRDAQIPPTIRVAQGQPIRIFTARDLDFSTVAAIAAAE